MADDVVIRMAGVWKRFGLPLPRWLTGQWISGSHRDAREEARPWVLRDINLEVRRGETLAVVGRNGAAKSTMLRILAGVTPPTHGRVEVPGRIFPMIEITGGLHQELTGRENIRLIGAIVGVPRRELLRLLPEIEEFTELGSWLDQPIRTYSTGMMARLGFGLGACLDSDVILIDEALSVGDLAFQNKTLARINQMHDRGAAIVLVTHSLDTAQFLAQRGVVLDDGRIVAAGSSLEALRAYEKLVFHGQGHRADAGIATARIYGPDGNQVDSIETGAPFTIEVDCHVNRTLRDALFSLAIINAAGVTCVWNVSDEDGLRRAQVAGGLRLRAWYPENHLMKGYYRVDFAVMDGASFAVIEQLSGISNFVVAGSGRARGVVAMRPRWELKGVEDQSAARS